MESTLIKGMKEQIMTAAGLNQSLGIILPSSNYPAVSQALFELMRNSSTDTWVYVTVNKPYFQLKKQFGAMYAQTSVQFIDCVSRAADIHMVDPTCIFLDSPSLLEQLLLEIINAVKEKQHPDGETYVIIDLLSSLIAFNDALLVREFFSHLINNMSQQKAHTISLSIEEEIDDKLHKILYLRNDKIIKVKESFI